MDMSDTSARASFKACHGAVSSTCSTPSVASIAIFIGYAAIAVGLFMRVGIDSDYVKNKEREAQATVVTATAGKEAK